MTFDEWYLENIVCGQPWGENKAYQDNHIYKAMKRAWDAGWKQGQQFGDYYSGPEDVDPNDWNFVQP
jgi:hypothetical protein